MGVALLKLTGMILQVLFFVRYDVVKQVCFYLLSLKLVVCRCLQLKMFKTWHGGKFPFWGLASLSGRPRQQLGSAVFISAR